MEIDYELFKSRGFVLSDGDFKWMVLDDYCSNIKLLPDEFAIEIRYEESDEVSEWSVGEAIKVLNSPFRHTRSWRPLMSNFAHPKPQVRVEYEEVTDSIFDLKDEFERGELCRNGGLVIDNLAVLASLWNEGEIYRRIEKPVDWSDDVIEFVESKNDSYMNSQWCVEECHLKDEDFLEMCRVALRATGELK